MSDEVERLRAENARLRKLLMDPSCRERELNRFCNTVPAGRVCECGHVAEDHDVRLNDDAHFERQCTARTCGCRDFAEAEEQGQIVQPVNEGTGSSPETPLPTGQI